LGFEFYDPVQGGTEVNRREAKAQSLTEQTTTAEISLLITGQ
jgi:hypothetical protein